MPTNSSLSIEKEIRMIVVAGGVPILPDRKDAALAACLEVEAPTRLEDGCISYTYYFGISDPNYLHIFEEWESEDALNAHLQTAHTQKFLGGIGDFAAGMPVVNKYIVS